MSDSPERWSIGEKLLHELGLRDDRFDADPSATASHRAKLPADPATLDTVAFRAADGSVVLCPAAAAIRTTHPQDGTIKTGVRGDEWIVSSASLSREVWR